VQNIERTHRLGGIGRHELRGEEGEREMRMGKEGIVLGRHLGKWDRRSDLSVSGWHQGWGWVEN
jgi:hypothetical protein